MKKIRTMAICCVLFCLSCLSSFIFFIFFLLWVSVGCNTIYKKKKLKKLINKEPIFCVLLHFVCVCARVNRHCMLSPLSTLCGIVICSLGFVLVFLFFVSFLFYQSTKQKCLNIMELSIALSLSLACSISVFFWHDPFGYGMKFNFIKLWYSAVRWVCFCAPWVENPSTVWLVFFLFLIHFQITYQP